MYTPQEKELWLSVFTEFLPEVPFSHFFEDCAKLTKEQEKFYYELTADLMNDSNVRHEAHRILAEDPRVLEVTDPLVQFIRKTCILNIVRRDLKNVVYSLQMHGPLLLNSTSMLEDYIPTLIAGPLDCLLADSISSKPRVEDHWRIRHYSNDMIARMVGLYKPIEPFIIQRYVKALTAKRLETVYGGIVGLSKLGEAAIRQYLLPKIAYFARRLKPYVWAVRKKSKANLRTIAAKKINNELVKICKGVLPKLIKDQKKIQPVRLFLRRATKFSSRKYR